MPSVKVAVVLALIAACGGSPAPPVANTQQPQQRPARARVHKTHLNVVLVGDNTFVEAALLIRPDVTVEAVPAASYAPERVANVDVVIFDGYTPSAWPSADLILINAARGPIPVRGNVANPRIITVAGHPVMRWVDLSKVRIDRSMVFDVESERGETDLATSNGGSVIAAKDDGQRVVALGFALSDSDLPMRAGFPMLLGNTLDWFAN